MNNTDKSMMPITLLIVDDDDIDREAIKRALRFTQRPLEIIEANTGRQGINQFQENKIDVLLIDYRLPDIDGFSVIRALKQSENVCTIIMVSQHEDEVVSAQAITVGAHDFLLKSEVNAERLNRAIHQAQHRHILENELRQKTKSLKSLAQTDYLTGLINRRSFEQILQESYVETHYSASTLAVLFIDLDHFKKINDSLGHSVGDKLLKKVAKRFKDSISKELLLARLGGDEFVILSQNIQTETEAIDIAQCIINCLQSPFIINSIAFDLSASIGISILGLCASTPEELMKCADIAMYKSKSHGRNQYRLYSDQMHAEAQNKQQLENELKSALKQNQFKVYYQPQINSGTNTVEGVEALVRWDHPQRGILSPAFFLELAEEMNLINEIGEWVLLTACTQLNQWHQDYELSPNELSVSVNLSALQLQDIRLLESVSSTLRKSGLDPCSLELEITESSIIHSPERIVGRLLELTQKNIKLSLDDFGTGYSSIQHLHLFPIHTLKIDKGFIAAHKQKSSQDQVLIAMIQFARTLGLKVIAEGVETKEQLQFCNDNKCDLIQGYYYSKPIPALEFEARFLKKSKAIA
ncbi:GGDEF domain-containing response regulator [Marinomonas algicola]|uniref:two-component system response regulator n=1 Tax=Marinomonas algicola TaxID=2773454 RepID=UPI00174889F3|nr:GGDEF domain-containing response regulator [Marinomonas algicola]